MLESIIMCECLLIKMTKRTDKWEAEEITFLQENSHLIIEVVIAKLKNYGFVTFMIILGSGKNDH